MLPEDDRMIETCSSVLNVLMQILDFLNNIYIYIYIYIYMHMLVCVIKQRDFVSTIHGHTQAGSFLRHYVLGPKRKCLLIFFLVRPSDDTHI
jgi:hypothetical protein